MKATGITPGRKVLPVPGENYLIQPTLLPDDRARDWWNSLSAQARTVTVVEVGEEQDRKIVFSGSIDLSWTLPQWAEPLAGISIALVSKLDAQGAESLTVTAFSGHSALNGEAISFSLGENAAGDLVLVADPLPSPSVLLPGKSSNRGLGQSLLNLADVFKAFPGIAGLRYSIGLLHQGEQMAMHRWTASLPDLKIGDFESPLHEVVIALEVDTYEDAVDQRLQLAIQARLGEDILVRGRIFSGERISLILSPFRRQGLPGPVDLLGFLGLGEAAGQLGEALKQAPVLNSLNVSRVLVEADLKKKKVSQVRVFGDITVEEHQVNFSLHWPQMTLNAHLSSLTPLHIGEFLKRAFPDWKDCPVNMKIVSLGVDLGIKPFSLGVGLALSDVWSFQLGDFPIELKEVELRGRYSGGQVRGRVAGRIALDGIDLAVSADNEDDGGWHFLTEAAHSEPIHLHEFLVKMRKFFRLPETGELPRIMLRNITAEFRTKSTRVVLEASASLEEPIGPLKKAESSLRVEYSKDEKSGEKTFEIRWKGQFEIAGQQFDFDIDLGNPKWYVEAGWKSEKGLDLLKLVHDVAGEADTSEVPAAVRDALTLTEIRISYHNDTHAFSLQARAKGGEEVKFMLLRSGNQWGAFLAAGYRKPESMPEFGEVLKKHAQDIVLDNVWLVFSWMPDDVSGLSTGGTESGLPVKLSELGSGLGLAAEFELGSQKAEAARRLSNITDQGKFSVFGQIFKDGSSVGIRLEVLWKGKLSIETQGAYPLVLHDCGIKFQMGPSVLAFEAHGSLDFHIEQYPVQLDVALDLNSEQFVLRGGLKTQKGGIPLFGLKNVRFVELDLMLGIQWEPPGAVLGLQGTMNFGKDGGLPYSLGVVLVFEDVVPIPLYFAVDIAHFELMELFRGTDTGDWAGKHFLSDHLVGADNLSFHWVRPGGKLLLPDGRMVEPGIGFHGIFHIWTWNAYLDFQFSQNQGFRGDGEFDPVKNDVFEITGRGTGRTVLAVRKGGRLQPVSNARPPEEGTPTTPMQIIRPGGAFLHFSSTHSPYLSTSFKVKVLDAFEWKTDILVDDSGLNCTLVQNIPNVYRLNFDLVMRPPQVMTARGDFFAGVYFDLPPFLQPLNNFRQQAYVGLTGILNIATGTEQAFHFYFNYGLKVLGLDMKGLSIKVPHTPRDFGDFVGIVMSNIGDNILRFICQTLLGPFCPAKSLPPSVQGRLMRGEPVSGRHAEVMTWPAALGSALRSGREEEVPHPDEIHRETATELEWLEFVREELKTRHAERVTRGLEALKVRMAVMEREIRDLEDRDGSLSAHCQEVWEQNGLEYTRLHNLIADLDHEVAGGRAGSDALQAAREGLEAVRARILEQSLEVAVDPDEETGYPDTEARFARVAVLHHAEMVRLWMEGEVEVHRIRSIAHARRSAPSAPMLLKRDIQPWTAQLRPES